MCVRVYVCDSVGVCVTVRVCECRCVCNIGVCVGARVGVRCIGVFVHA